MRRVIVTRPAREAQEWVRGLQAAGFDALAIPLIEIRPVRDTAPLAAAWQALESFQAVMFVSGNAAAAFFAARPEGMVPAAFPRAWATGPGTREALEQAGWPPGLIDSPDPSAGQFDSEALWGMVAGSVRAGSRVLIVRGSDASGSLGRDWLASRLESAGAEVATAVAYERHPPRLGMQQIEIAASAASGGAAWLFSSSQAVANLRALLPSQDFSRARAVATHPRIAQAARDAGFGVVCESRPSLAEVARSIESVG